MTTAPPTNIPTPSTTDSNSSPNQSNTEDDQIYEIDIDKIYQDYIQYIDSKRSYVNVIGQNTAALYAAVSGDITSTAPTSNNVVPSASVQESRCHAFYRIIGFPVVNNNQSKIYNPGHDIINPERLSAKGDKIGIAQNPITGFTMLSNYREQYFLNNLKIFSNPTTVDAGALSLSGGADAEDKRPFAAPFAKSSDPFDMTITNQNYPGIYNSRVGDDDTVQLSDYLDASGAMPAAATLPPNKFHIIKPFIVDPRIDFSCSPSTNRIGVPFVPNKSYLQISSSAYADVPLLETIIRNRVSVTDQTQNSGDYTQQFATFIKNISNNPNETILGQINSNDIQQLSTNAQFQQFVNIIQAMVIKLVEAQKTIAMAQGLYYWLPIPSVTGPEGGSSIQGVFIPTTQSQQAGLITTADGNILIATAQSLFSQTQQNPQASAAQAQPDPGGFAVAVANSLGPSSSASFVNNSMATLDMLGAKRTGILTQAGDALRIVEIIMGEFSGLGLCDILAILGALYTMPAINLLGFLDSFAVARMNTQYNNTFPVISYQTAMNSFSSTVNQFYQLTEAIYINVYNTQGIST